MFSKLIHIGACASAYSFLLPNSILFCGYIKCIHLLVNEYLYFFQLGVLRIALLWTSVYQFLCGHTFSVALVIYLWEELLGPVVALCLTLHGTAGCHPKWMHRFTFLLAVCPGFGFSTCSALFYLFFFNSHPSEYQVVSHCDFDFFPHFCSLKNLLLPNSQPLRGHCFSFRINCLAICGCLGF